MRKNIYLIIATIFFLALGLWVTKFSRLSIDLPVSLYVQNVRHPLFGLLMRFVSWIGDSLMLEIIMALAAIILIRLGLKFQAALAVTVTGLGAITGVFLKFIFSRPRPDPILVETYKDLSDKSFPSLHVLVYTVFFGYLLCLSVTKIKNSYLKYAFQIISSLMIILIGLSRIYLGAHWASDTIGGYLLGYIFINLTLRYAKR